MLCIPIKLHIWILWFVLFIRIVSSSFSIIILFSSIIPFTYRLVNFFSYKLHQPLSALKSASYFSSSYSLRSLRWLKSSSSFICLSFLSSFAYFDSFILWWFSLMVECYRYFKVLLAKKYLLENFYAFLNKSPNFGLIFFLIIFFAMNFSSLSNIAFLKN